MFHLGRIAFKGANKGRHAVHRRPSNLVAIPGNGEACEGFAFAGRLDGESVRPLRVEDLSEADRARVSGR